MQAHFPGRLRPGIWARCCGESLASPSTLGAILAAKLAANALGKTHEAQVRQRFAPVLVARQEVFGYLLNDMAGKQLLHSDYAMPVGQRGDNAVIKAKS